MSMTLSKVLGTQIPAKYVPEEHVPSKERLEIISKASTGVKITALMDQLGMPLFPEKGQDRFALPIGADNEMCHSPDKVESVFIVKQSSHIVPSTDMGLILSSIEEYKPTIQPNMGEDKETAPFCFEVDGFDFKGTLSDMALTLQLYYGLNQVMQRSKETAFMHLPPTHVLQEDGSTNTEVEDAEIKEMIPSEEVKKDQE